MLLAAVLVNALRAMLEDACIHLKRDLVNFGFCYFSPGAVLPRRYVKYWEPAALGVVDFQNNRPCAYCGSNWGTRSTATGVVPIKAIG